MKRYITLLLLIALFPSCETALDMGDDGLGDVLLMNAQMCTSETTHTVWLSLNSPDMISSVSGATVSCYVNDRLVSSTRTVEETDEQSLSPFLKGGFQASGLCEGINATLRTTQRPLRLCVRTGQVRDQ